MSDALTIVSLISENYMGLKAIRIDPKGNTVIVSGKNGQGKTSALNSIEAALGGKESVCEDPIRHGQQKARIVCDLGELLVERTFSATSGDSQLRVRTKDGTPVKSPQKMLDELCSHVAFDPLSFVRMKPIEQVATLSKLVGIDLTELNAKRKAAYDNRTLAGRELDAAKVRLASAQFYPDLSDVEVSVDALMAELTKRQNQNTQNMAVRNKLEQRKAALQETVRERVRLQGEIARLEELLSKTKVQCAKVQETEAAAGRELLTLETEVAALVPADEESVKKEIQEITLTNKKVQDNKRHQEQNKEFQEKQFAYDKLTAEIEAIDEQKRDMLAWAEFPLEGLGFDDSKVLLDGVPFGQCNQARQLQAAVAIGLALNPKVRVILCRDGSLLDEDSMKVISELAIAHHAQIWVERVSDDSPGAIIISDGEVKEVAA